VVRIRDIVRQALATGRLTIEAEDRLRQLLRQKNSVEDLKAFMHLQRAARAGLVEQESRTQEGKELRGSAAVNHLYHCE
jgi:phage I-like protein